MKRNIKIEQLYIYSLKSTKGQPVEMVPVQKYGFDNDRRVAIIDSKGRVVTGREHPKLVLLGSELKENYLVVASPSILVTFSLPRKRSPIPIRLFRNEIFGIPFGPKANTWISEHLGGDYRLVFLGEKFRPIPEKRGGR
ncbi:MAG: MOSC N-terminal beta barrel domain-containing protein, partial [Maribacter sp.]